MPNSNVKSSVAFDYALRELVLVGRPSKRSPQPACPRLWRKSIQTQSPTFSHQRNPRMALAKPTETELQAFFGYGIWTCSMNTTEALSNANAIILTHEPTKVVRDGNIFFTGLGKARPGSRTPPYIA